MMAKNIISKLKFIFIPCEENKFRPKFLESKALTYYILVLLILKLFAIPFFIYFPKSVFFADITKSILINLTNKNRELVGIQSLKENQKLNEIAYLKAKDMIEKDYFSHSSPQGNSPWYWFKEGGYDYQVAGENLAIGFLDSEEVVSAWLNSPSHKKNLLNSNYQETGIAVLKGNFQGKETTLIVQFFAAPRIVSLAKEKPKTITKKPQEEITATPTIIQSKETPLVLGEVKEKDKLGYLFSNFLAFDYHNLMQKIIYGSLILIIAALLLNIFIRINIQHKDLIFKTSAFVVLLVLFVLVDKLDIIKLIPHNFRIY